MDQRIPFPHLGDNLHGKWIPFHNDVINKNFSETKKSHYRVFFSDFFVPITIFFTCDASEHLSNQQKQINDALNVVLFLSP